MGAHVSKNIEPNDSSILLLSCTGVFVPPADAHSRGCGEWQLPANENNMVTACLVVKRKYCHGCKVASTPRRRLIELLER
jgi:hypothetical protein